MKSALRTLIANLEASRSSDHWWLEFCTALVAIGVLFEVIFVIWEYVDELHDFRRGVVHPPETPNILLFALGLLGAGLVALGVAGEFRFEARIESIETHVRKANDDLFLLLSKEAGEAAASAKTAHDEADAAGVAADRAMRKARDAEEYATPRSISDKQAALIRKRIQPLKGHKIVFFGNFHETEISDFANRLAATLDSGIMDVSSGVWQAGMVTPSGMKFGYGKARKTDFDLIVRALDEAGVEKAAVLRKQSSIVGTPGDWLTITFGAKH